MNILNRFMIVFTTGMREEGLKIIVLLLPVNDCNIVNQIKLMWHVYLVALFFIIIT